MKYDYQLIYVNPPKDPSLLLDALFAGYEIYSVATSGTIIVYIIRRQIKR